eukprot:2651462-Prymnesium_polylepis.1
MRLRAASMAVAACEALGDTCMLSHQSDWTAWPPSCPACVAPPGRAEDRAAADVFRAPSPAIRCSVSLSLLRAPSPGKR